MEKRHKKQSLAKKITEWFLDFGQYAFSYEKQELDHNDGAIAYKIRVHLFLYISFAFEIRYYLDGYIKIRVTIFWVYFEFALGKTSLLVNYPTKLFYKKLNLDEEIKSKD